MTRRPPGRPNRAPWTRLGAVSALLLFLAAPPARAGELITPSAELGMVPGENLVDGPVFDGEGVDPISFERLETSLPPGSRLLRFPKKNGSVKELKYVLSPAVDLGALLATTLRSQARAMGLPTSSGSEPDRGRWTVTGEVRELYFEYRVVMMGAILFFGHLDLELVAEHSDGRTVTVANRYLNHYSQFNGGFGAADELTEVTSRFLLESSQEAVAGLARRAFGAAAHGDLQRLLEGPMPADPEQRALALRRLGWSGIAGAEPFLLARLDAAREVDDQVAIVDALANLPVGEEAGRELARRYGTADEDVRFFVLKALAYADSPALPELAAMRARIEPSLPLRRVAQHLAAERPRRTGTGSAP